MIRLERRLRDIKLNRYENLIVACGAVLFINIIMPVLDSLSGMAISAVNKTINGWQLDMELDKCSAEVQANQIGGNDCTRAIGFAIPNDEDNREENYE